MAAAEAAAQAPTMMTAASGYADGQPVTHTAPNPGFVVQHAPKQSLTEGNTVSVTAIAVVIAYIVLAASTGIVLLGIFPVALSVRAFRRGEKLAPVALGAAILAVLLALTGH